MMMNIPELGNDKYTGKNVRWINKGDHYELIFTDNFVTPSSGRIGSGALPMPGSSSLTDIICDMKDADKHKEIHVFIGSFGGEVAALSMLLQQLLQFDHRVGINLGTACSCGWMLLFACQERYVSPYSQALYHDISTITFGKHSEIRNQNIFMDRWQQELNKVTDTEKVLTAKELELGKTSEVWFTGAELIERGAARDYSEYLVRKMPVPAVGIISDMQGNIYQRKGKEYIRLVPAGESPVSYMDILRKTNAAPAGNPSPLPDDGNDKNGSGKKKNH
ncbi:MAG: ATP-dependent Clp protease proteolytic subunit [Victivallaceae bacterium]|nr:ATP-dependent Clp protease proteolytic subunit [Victivallaceae bacterium]